MAPVLDDLHAVADIAVHELLLELVVSSGNRLHPLAIARHDPLWPLHRMRLDGLLTSLRAEDLAFDDAEALALFTSLGVPVRPERISQLVVRTQGLSTVPKAARDRCQFVLELAHARELGML